MKKGLKATMDIIATTNIAGSSAARSLNIRRVLDNPKMSARAADVLSHHEICSGSGERLVRKRSLDASDRFPPTL
jgi:hypothetical protein